MGVYIKGMEMPKNCHECRLYEGDIYYCSAADKEIDILDSSEGKCKFCPLVPVPPHGRLIDTDAVSLEGGPYEYDEWCKWALGQYQDAPTVIPSSSD